MAPTDTTITPTDTTITVVHLNAPTHFPIKLTPTNFSVWSRQVQSTLIGLDLIGYIDGSTAAPSKSQDGSAAPNPSYLAWYRQDQVIVAALLGSCVDSIQPLISTATSSREAWNRLNNTYASTTPGRVLFLKARLAQNPRGTRTIADYLKDMGDIADALALAGHPLSDSDLVTSIITQLGEEYRSVYSALRVRETAVTLADLSDILQDIERLVAPSDPPPLLPTANYTRFGSSQQSGGSQQFDRSRRGRGSRGGRGGRFGGRTSFGGSHADFSQGSNTVICQFCYYPGHTAKVCRKLAAFLMIIGTIAAIGNGLSQPVMTMIIGDLIGVFARAQKNEVESMVTKVSLKFVYLALGTGAAAFLQVYCWTITGVRQSARIRSLYLKTILRQDVAYFDQEVSSGEVIGRMTDDTTFIQDAIGDKVGKFVEVTASFIGGFVVAFVKGWLLTLVLSTSILLVVISAAFIFFISFKMASRAQRSYSDAADVVQQTIGSIRTVASFTGENQAAAKYSRLLTTVYKSDMVVGLSTGLGTGFLMFTSSCTFALAVWFGSRMILHKGYTGGEVFTVLLAVMIGSFSLGQAAPPMTAISAGRASAIKMFETINRKPVIDAYDPKGSILNDISGDIEFRDVCFSYPARPKDRIFDEFSLLIPSGTTAALVGQSGSGKSTVISLIERFYDPVSGAVLIDGVDLRKFQLKWIRSKIGLVSQEPVLFTTSIKDNIAYGKDGATLDEIRAAAELANATEFIDKLPQGLDMMVGENGIQLSGGQKQRIAIARAILRNPRILLLDEATSALDSDSERIVQEALERIMVDRTTVIVAHRLSTIRNANMIAVLHQGKIVEKGTHFELLKDTQGAYSNLIHSQEVSEDMGQNIDNQYMPDNSTSQKIMHTSSLSSESYRVDNASSRLQSLSFSKSAEEKENAFSPEATKDLPKVSMWRLARLNKPETLVLIVGSVFGSLTGATMPIYGLLISLIIKTFYEMPHQLKKDAEIWALRFVILGLVSLIIFPLGKHLFSVAGTKLIQRIRLMCFEKMVTMEIGWFDMPENSSGVIGARLSNDVAKIRAIVGDALAMFVQETASILVALVIALQASWQLTLITLALMPLVGFNAYLQSSGNKGSKGDAKLMYDEASQIAKDAVSNIRTVGSFCAQERIVEMYKKKCEGPIINGIREGLISALTFGSSMCSVFFVYAATFYAGARLVEDGKTTFSQVFRVFYVLTMVTHGLSVSRSLAPDSSKAKSAVASVFAILDRKSKIDPSDETGMTLDDVQGHIELKHVTFSYPTRLGIQVLRDLSLTINRGEIVALVGESGSGKSTIISLIQRFYDPDTGDITLDGIKMHKFQVKWLRQQMGLVNQEPVLFNDTIRANIAFAKGGSATEAEIIDAAKLANAHDFISGLQQGYDTIVGERGVQLSGGQKQRVAIARAIVKSPKILLLDEATSALDAESEKVVQMALDKVMLNRTTVVVAHRLSTIMGADEIAVFRNGSIVEKGNHNTLINIPNGFYSSLVTLQKTALS